METTKQGCRECGEVDYHKQDCSLNGSAVEGIQTIVLDSERIQTDRVCPDHCGHDPKWTVDGQCLEMVYSSQWSGLKWCGHRCAFPDQLVAPDSAEVRHLLQCLAEECAEVIQACSKALRFGLDDNYKPDSASKYRSDVPFLSPRLQIREELTDTAAIALMLRELGVLPQTDETELEAKIARVESKMDYAREKGML